ncbi:eukaryotic translation elongation factor 1 epsilon-1 isoform X1 [Macrobrachium rosenbergii]|uniref:eukaryotic translation elongation factor 1 epsilon-1 isoform X1 n=1 Tax=Macrobrachium rosenbergii TaxID=79674 RepID=UPI0034D3A031
MEKKIVSDFAKYLGAAKVKVASEKNGVIVEVGGKKFSGFVCGVLNLVRLQKQSLEGSTVLQRCLTHDWLTQCATDLFRCSTYEELNSNLHYIDKELLTRTYLCGHMVTAADVIMFLILYPFVAKWTYQQKEILRLKFQSVLPSQRRTVTSFSSSSRRTLTLLQITFDTLQGIRVPYRRTVFEYFTMVFCCSE